MADSIKERKEIDPQFMWDLSTLFANDEAWEAALPELTELTASAAGFYG